MFEVNKYRRESKHILTMRHISEYQNACDITSDRKNMLYTSSSRSASSSSGRFRHSFTEGRLACIVECVLVTEADVAPLPLDALWLLGCSSSLSMCTVEFALPSSADVGCSTLSIGIMGCRTRQPSTSIASSTDVMACWIYSLCHCRCSKRTNRLPQQCGKTRDADAMNSEFLVKRLMVTMRKEW